jgi:transposase
MKFSALPGWKIAGISKTAVSTVVQVDLLTKPLRCRHCSASSELLREHGKTALRVRDVPMRGKPVEILLSRRRYVCGKCKGTSLQGMPGVDENLHATVRLIELAATRAFRRPFRQVAGDLGLSEKFVRAAFSQEVERLESIGSLEAPRHLTLDVVYASNRGRVLLTDAESHRVIGITADASILTTRQTLLNLPEHERIGTVTIPMSRLLAVAASLMLPRATIIIDRFHVMSLGNHAFEQVRERVHLHSPRSKDGKVLVAAAFFLKARFIDVFRTDSSCVARRRYAEWMAELPEELMFAFGPVVQTINHWSEHIFGYFDHHFPEANLGATDRSTEDAPPNEQSAGFQQVPTQDLRNAVTG